MILMEQWKDVEGYEGMYQVSNLGRVKSLSRKRAIGSNWRIIEERILKPQNAKDGYKQVNLCRDGRQKSVTVHRLVAETFIDNPDNKKTINHISGIKEDNRLINLEWMSQTENNRHAIAMGLNVPEDRPRKPIICNETGVHYNSLKQATEELKIPSSCISRVLKGQRKHTYGLTFSYLSK